MPFLILNERANKPHFVFLNKNYWIITALQQAIYESGADIHKSPTSWKSIAVL